MYFQPKSNAEGNEVPIHGSAEETDRLSLDTPMLGSIDETLRNERDIERSQLPGTADSHSTESQTFPGCDTPSSHGSLPRDFPSQDRPYVIKFQGNGEEHEVVFELANEAQVDLFETSSSGFEYVDETMPPLKGILKSCAWENKSSGWVLRNTLDKLEIFCRCCTFLREVIISTPHGSKPAKAVVITSIFTKPDYRGQGLATYLLRSLQQIFDDRPDPELAFTMIWSRGNTNLYARLGWRPAVRAQVILDVPDGLPLKIINDRFALLGLEDIHCFQHSHDNMAKKRLSAMRNRNQTHVEFLFSEDMFFWHLFRTEQDKIRLGTEKDLPSKMGAKIYYRHSQICLARIWWFHDYVAKRLYVSRILPMRKRGVENQMSALLWLALEEARDQGFRQVVLWDPDEQTLQGVRILMEQRENLQAVYAPREDFTPCLRWVGGDGRAIWCENLQYYAFQ